MFTVFLMTLAIFAIVVVGMAIGYIVQKKTLAGSCGGLGSVGIEKACNCDSPCEKRQERERLAAEKQQVSKGSVSTNKIDITNI